MEAHIRYGTVHDAKKGQPLFPDTARKIAEAVHRITGVAYTGKFALIDLNDKVSDQFPTIPKSLARGPER
jgi:hypothetical protein